MSQLTLLSVSLAAIVLLALIARMLKLGESRIVDGATAVRFAEEALAGFEGGEALVSSDGSGALVAGIGTVAVIKRHGARVAVRRLVPPLKLQVAVEGVAVDTGERIFGKITLLGITQFEVQALEDAARRAGVGQVVTLH